VGGEWNDSEDEKEGKVKGSQRILKVWVAVRFQMGRAQGLIGLSSS
jgi:hypothetical protein